MYARFFDPEEAARTLSALVDPEPPRAELVPALEWIHSAAQNPYNDDSWQALAWLIGMLVEDPELRAWARSRWTEEGIE